MNAVVSRASVAVGGTVNFGALMCARRLVHSSLQTHWMDVQQHKSQQVNAESRPALALAQAQLLAAARSERARSREVREVFATISKTPDPLSHEAGRGVWFLVEVWDRESCAGMRKAESDLERVSSKAVARKLRGCAPFLAHSGGGLTVKLGVGLENKPHPAAARFSEALVREAHQLGLSSTVEAL